MTELLQHVNRHIDAHAIGGDHLTSPVMWPDDVTHAFTYRTKCWPCEMGETKVAFFSDADSADAWVADMEDWARQDGNSFFATSYVWDLGPVMGRSFF